MKFILHACILLLFAVPSLNAADPVPGGKDPLKPFTPKADAKGSWQFKPDPRLPDVLIIGDSISIGYTRAVRDELKGEFNVFRPMAQGGKGPANCGDTIIGLKGIDGWLGGRKWAVIHFNWGLWDLCYRNPESKTQGNRDKVEGKLTVTPEDYEKNLETLVGKMEATGAKLIWASTTAVPEGEVGRHVEDAARYNEVAARVMKKHGIATNDLYAVTKDFAGRFSIGKGDVHYTAEGSRELAAKVAAAIRGADGAAQSR